jgi:amino acid adenylation domain-containing protein
MLEEKILRRYVKPHYDILYIWPNRLDQYDLVINIESGVDNIEVHITHSLAVVSEAAALNLTALLEKTVLSLVHGESHALQTLDLFNDRDQCQIQRGSMGKQAQMHDQRIELHEVDQILRSPIEKQQPRSTAEQRLQNLWARELGLTATSIGIHDDFFRLGGDSVSAMRLVREARSQNISLTVADVFRNPILADLASASRSLSSDAGKDQERRKFSLWAVPESELQQKLEEISKICGFDWARIDDVYPASPMQEGLMTLTAQQPKAYTMQMVFKLAEEMDIHRLKVAWQRLVEVLPILRTRIVMVASGSLQVVVDEPDISWCEGKSLDMYKAQDLEQPMSYGTQLTRQAIIKDKGRIDSQYFVWTAHHSLYDGWSSSLILQLLGQIYSELLLPSSLTPGMVQYNRVIGYMVERDASKDSYYWRSQLEGGSPSTLPLRDTHGYQPRSTGTIINEMPIMRQASSNMTVPILLRAAWAMVVARHTDSDDVTFGATLSGRNIPVPGIMEMVGPTVTTVPVRVRLEYDETVLSYCERIQKQATDMIPFEHTGLQNIRKFGPEVHRALNFQNLLIIHPVDEQQDLAFPGLQPEPSSLDGFNTYGLVLECKVCQKKGIINFEAQFDSNIISEKEVSRMLSQHIHIFGQLCGREAQDSKLKEIDAISPEDIREIANWTRSELKSKRECIHHAFTRIMSARPDAPAICSWDGNLTYRILDRWSSQLAGYLIDHGVRNGIVIPLCFEKSKKAIISMLAVLKAGGVCASLDPKSPTSRLATVIDVLNAPLVLVDTQHAHLFQTFSMSCVVIEEALFEGTRDSDRQVESATHPTDPAFVVFTSGSTGTPKGVILQHDSICTSAEAHGSELSIGEQSRVLQFAAYTFDVSIQDIFTTLMRGGCVCVIPESSRLDSTKLAASITELQANWACLTSTVAGLLKPSDVPGLATLVLGGEAASQEVVAEWANHVTLHNVYGPAEASIWSSCNADLSAHTSALNIGRPLASRFWVTEAGNHDMLAPLGCVGELLIEGPLLARGYLNDIEQTGNVFIRDPLWISKYGFSAGKRLYKTGDLVRYNPDGSLKFVNRKDTQVKMNGRRVDLREIEYYTRKHLMSGSMQVAVELGKISSQKDRQILVAFWWSLDIEDSVDFDSSPRLPASIRIKLQDMQALLANDLPAYMVPRVFIPLSHFPMNASGKLDRGRLRQQIATLSSEQCENYMLSSPVKQQPSSHMERQLRDLWAKELGIESSFGVNDNFFQLGGDSICAIRVVAAANAIHISLTVPNIFQFPRLSDLARVVTVSEPFEMEDAQPFALWTPESPKHLEEIAAYCQVQSSQIEDVFPCTPLQEGLMAVSAQQAGAYVVQKVFKLAESTSIKRFEMAWQQSFDNLPILRTRIVVSKSGALQATVKESIIWYKGASLSLYLSEDLDTPMSYGGPLARYALVEEQGKDGQITRYFVWTAHHSLYDAWSATRLFEHVACVYMQNSVPPTVPFARFIRYLGQKDMEAMKTYWQGYLRDAPETGFLSSLPPKHRPEHIQVISRDVGINHKPESGVTIATMLRAAWALTLIQYTESSNVIFDATLSGREIPLAGVTDIVAPTITTVPILVRVDWEETVDRYLRKIQVQASEMIPFEHFGLQNMRRLSPTIQQALDSVRHLFVVQTVDEQNRTQTRAFLDSQEVQTSHTGFTTYPVVVECVATNDSIHIRVAFDQAAIADTQMQRMVAQFANITRELVKSDRNGRQALSEMNMMSPQDIEDISSWNQKVPAPVDACIHRLVEGQIKLRPNATAIQAWDESFSYRELGDLSTALAIRLMESDVELRPDAEARVILCFDKSPWAIVAMLAVLKAGRTCVPLDPKAPQNRIQQILQDTSSSPVLCASQHSKLFESRQRPYIVVEASPVSNLPHKHRNALATVQPHNAAFVLYTSGSTGVPKGVVLEHRGICTNVQTLAKVCDINHDTRIGQFSAYTFDISVLDIFIALQSGACLCIISEQDRLNNLAGGLRSLEVNTMILTSTVASLLQPSDLPSLKTLILTGEPVQPAVVNVWGPHARVQGIYGPTECSISVTCSPKFTHSARDNVANLGRPLAALAWVVDPSNHNRLRPIGAIGELLIEGPLVSRGYLDDTPRTEEAFIQDPSWILKYGLVGKGLNGKGRRMYKTGDLVRYTTGGYLEYRGRKDTQVKINGQRVELGEVEHHLSDEIGQQVAVELVQLPEPYNRKVLASFIKIQTEEEGFGDVSTLSITEGLRRKFFGAQSSLSNLLPAFMIPAIYVPLKQFPLTASGKLWRHELRNLVPRLTADQIAQYMLAQANKDGPRTEMELRLQQLWAEALGLKPATIGIEDYFFRLGGDSISAMKLAAAARSSHISLQVSDVFRYPKLSEMAKAAVMSHAQTTTTSETSIAPFELWVADARARAKQLKEIKREYALAEDEVEDVYPCTPLQEGILVGQQVAAYVVQRVFKIPPSLQLDRFKAAWQKMTEKLPILRTCAVPSGRGLLQVVLNRKIVWRHQSSLEAYLENDKDVPFNYGSMLARYAIVGQDTKTETAYFVWTIHHALYDGWSMALLLKQVSRIYTHGYVPESAPFTRFISYLAKKDPDSIARYWRLQLKGNPHASFPPLSVKNYRPQPSKLLRQQLENVKHWSDATLSILLRAAWALTVSRYSGHDDVVFGVTLSGRTAPVAGIMEMVAPIITTVPVRVQIDYKSTTVQSYLDSLQEQAVGMLEFEHSGIQNIRRLCPEEKHAVDFNSRLTVQPQPSSDRRSEFLGLKAESLPYTGLGTYPLLVECHVSGGDVEIELHFDERVMAEKQTENILQHYTHMIRQLADSNPTILLSDLQFISPQDLGKVLEWNRQVPEPVQACVHETVQKQASLTPDAAALHSLQDGEITYSELNSLSSKLAKHLRDRGLRPETMIPLLFDKSPWAIVAMLAVLKAGGVCVPLDPKHPSQRLGIILHDINAHLVLLSDGSEHRIGSLTRGLDVIKVSRSQIQNLPDAMDKDCTCREVRPSNAAFVMYTSGTTGVPKGVVLEHRNLSTYLKHFGYLCDIDSTSRIGQFAAYTFDVSISDIFLGLSQGACVCVISENDRFDGLAKALGMLRVNWINLTSTVARLIQPEEVPSIIRLVLSGEPARKDVIAKWAAQKHVRVIELYGPTESTIHMSCNSRVDNPDQAANIGQPAGALTWIVDRLGLNELCPVGVVGELLIEGPLLSRGYLHDERSTCQAFITDPSWITKYGLAQGRRFYKTGDLVRYTDNGSLEIIGRMDNQLKIHGQRVETSEIEHYIDKYCPDTSGALVGLIRHTEAGGKEKDVLVAFLQYRQYQNDSDVFAGTLIPNSDVLRGRHEALRARLADALPAYMVPSAYIPVTRFPTTVSGKLDRKALFSKVTTPSENLVPDYLLFSTIKQRPSTRTEVKLRQIWAGELGVPTELIGANDNFFTIGGDSVNAIRLASKSRSEGLFLSVANVFSYPILSDMAATVDALLGDGEQVNEEVETRSFSLLPTDKKDMEAFIEGTVCQLTASPRENIIDVLPMTNFQAICVAGAITKSRWMLNYFTLDGIGPLNVDNLRNSWAEVIGIHEILRTVFILHEGAFLQVVLKAIDVNIDLYETEMDINQFTKALKEKDLHQVPVLGRPLARIAIVRRKGNLQHRIIVRISHAQYDGICMPRFWKGLSATYSGTKLCPDPGFRRYISHSFRLGRDSQCISHWIEFMKGSSMTRITDCTPTALPRPSKMTSSYSRRISVTGHAMPTFTIATVVKATWALVLAQMSASADVVFGNLITGRNEGISEIEKIMGPCVNIIPLRVGFRENWNFLDLLNCIRDQQIANIPFESLGFRDLAKHCTTWARSTYYGSYVQHQNIDIDESLFLGQTEYKITSSGPEEDLADVLLFSRPLDENSIELTVKFASHRVSTSVAEDMLEAVCSVMKQYLIRPFDPIPGPEALRSLNAKLPVTLTRKQLPKTILPVGGKKDTEVVAIWHSCIAHLWDKALNLERKVDDAATRDDRGMEVSFFEAGGDFESAAKLTVLLRKQDVEVTIEDVFDNDTMASQIKWVMRAAVANGKPDFRSQN